MNQKGEVTLTSCLITLALTGLVLLSALELRQSFSLLEKRTRLFLCLKETKGEFHQFTRFMGRANWGIRNLNRASLIMLFIPGAQGGAMNAGKLKKFLQHSQEIRLISYLKTLTNLKRQGCPLDPQLFITPFQSGPSILSRDKEGAAILRKNEWTYGFLSRPYLVTMKVNLNQWENIHPTPRYKTEEKAAKLSSLLSSL
jgi:hypothetical protein